MKNDLKTKIAAGVTAGLVALGGGYYITQEAYDQGKAFEGKVTQAYPDIVYGWNLPTICYGHTQGVKKGDTATDEQCEEWFKEDMAKGCETVASALGQDKFNSLTQGEQDAYCMFAHNTGYFKTQRNGNPTGMYRRLVAGDRVGACGVLLQYKYANGKALKGLEKRRTYEYERCLADLGVDEETKNTAIRNSLISSAQAQTHTGRREQDDSTFWRTLGFINIIFIGFFWVWFFKSLFKKES